MEKTLPRSTPDRDSKYMGLAWMYAGLSKDPSTQVGAVVITDDNYPLGFGYNGPPRRMKDDEVIWDRPPKDNPDAMSKYDMMAHAEVNAFDHCCSKPTGATLYVTALPCKDCMLDIIRNEIGRVVYFDFQSATGSSLQNAAWRDKTFDLAKRGRIIMDQFDGDLSWVESWVERLKALNVFGT